MGRVKFSEDSSVTMSAPQDVVRGLPVIGGRLIGVELLKSYLVESGGKAFLLQNCNIPADDHYVIVSMNINNEGLSLGGFNVFWNGPRASVSFTEKSIFLEGDDKIKISWNVTPRDVKFLENSWMSNWMDGAERVVRKEFLVEYESKDDPEPIRESYMDSSRQCSYRFIIIVKNANEPVLVVQVLPTDLATISSSPWANSSHVSGICVLVQDLSWYPTLPPEYGHSGPAPFLVDLRITEAKEQNNFISSQLYRDIIVYALTKASAPIDLSAQTAVTYAPTGLEVPRVGSFYRVVEEDRSSGHLSLDEMCLEHLMKMIIDYLLPRAQSFIESTSISEFQHACLRLQVDIHYLHDWIREDTFKCRPELDVKLHIFRHRLRFLQGPIINRAYMDEEISYWDKRINWGDYIKEQIQKLVKDTIESDSEEESETESENDDENEDEEDDVHLYYE